MTIRILVVDDDRDLLNLIENFLSTGNPDFSITLSESAQNAIQLLEESDYDAVVCDYHLGTGMMTGLELLEWLRESGSNISFVMFTGRSREEVAIRALNLGANFYLRKDDDDFNSLFTELAHDIRSAVEIKRVEDQLRESEARFRNLYESSLDGIVATDLEGIITQYNKTFADLLGYGPDDLIGTTYRDLSPKAWHKLEEQVGAEVQSIGYSRLFEQELITSDASQIPVAVTSWRMENEKQESVGSWSIIRDISSRRLAEEAVRESEEKFRTVFEDSPNAIALFDSNGSLIDANRACLDIFGVASLQKIIGYNIFDDPDFPNESKEKLRIGQNLSIDVNYDFSLVQERRLYETSRADNVKFRVIASPFGILKDGKVMGYSMQIFPKGEREFSISTMTQTLQTLSSFFHNTPVALAFYRIESIDDNGYKFIIMDVNQTFENVLSIERDSLIGKELSGSLGELGKDMKITEIIQNVVSSDESVAEEFYLQSLNKWISLTVYQPLPGIIASAIVDITEGVRVYQELQNQKEELSEFAHHMRHDIANYILKLRGLLELLKRNPSDELFSRLNKLLTEMKALIDHSVVLADAGLIVEKGDIVDLDIESKIIADGYVSDSIVYYQDKLPSVRADRTKLVQVLQNLLENATVHGKPSSLEIRRNDTMNGVQLLIINDGMQIPRETRIHIFERGFTTRAGNRGLGLTLVKKIINAHGWEIDLVESAKTTFVITIPLADIV